MIVNIREVSPTRAYAAIRFMENNTSSTSSGNVSTANYQDVAGTTYSSVYRTNTGNQNRINYIPSASPNTPSINAIFGDGGANGVSIDDYTVNNEIIGLTIPQSSIAVTQGFDAEGAYILATYTFPVTNLTGSDVTIDEIMICTTNIYTASSTHTNKGLFHIVCDAFTLANGMTENVTVNWRLNL